MRLQHDQVEASLLGHSQDFINGGGVINVADEPKPGGYDRDRAYALIARIGEKVTRALKLADELGISSAAAAEVMADERLKGAVEGEATGRG